MSSKASLFYKGIEIIIRVVYKTVYKYYDSIKLEEFR